MTNQIDKKNVFHQMFLKISPIVYLIVVLIDINEFMINDESNSKLIIINLEDFIFIYLCYSIHLKC